LQLSIGGEDCSRATGSVLLMRILFDWQQDLATLPIVKIAPNQENQFKRHHTLNKNDFQ
jgi:hypothetical protein